jgi:hypothetical protein
VWLGIGLQHDLIDEPGLHPQNGQQFVLNNLVEFSGLSGLATKSTIRVNMMGLLPGSWMDAEGTAGFQREQRRKMSCGLPHDRSPVGAPGQRLTLVHRDCARHAHATGSGLGIENLLKNSLRECRKPTVLNQPGWKQVVLAPDWYRGFFSECT